VRGCTMVEFDQLPQKSRSLILATLALDIASRNCRSIFDLALRRKQTVHDVWRDVCRKTAQPRCTMPRRVLESQYNGTSFAGLAAAPPSVASPIATSVERPAAPPATAPSVMQFGDVIAVTTAAAAPNAAPTATAAPVVMAAVTTAAPGRRAPSRYAMLAAGLAAALLLATGLAIAVTTYHSTQPGRFDGVVDIGRANSGVSTTSARADAVSVPAPEGTLRRMDAISKSFSKQ
jgi:hypothetical protein